MPFVASYSLHKLIFPLLVTYIHSVASTSAVIPLQSVNYGISLNIEVEIGDQTFHVIPDSGSADL